MLWLLVYFFTTLVTQVFNPPLVRLSEPAYITNINLESNDSLKLECDHALSNFLCVYRLSNPYPQHSRSLFAVPSAHFVASAVDIDINPGPNLTYTSRLYQCGTCDVTVDLGEKGIVCETWDQWYQLCVKTYTPSAIKLSKTQT